MKHPALVGAFSLALITAAYAQVAPTAPAAPTPEQDLMAHWQTYMNMESALPGVRDDFVKSANALIADYHGLQAKNKQLEGELAQLKKAAAAPPAATPAPTAPAAPATTP